MRYPLIRLTTIEMAELVLRPDLIEAIQEVKATYDMASYTIIRMGMNVFKVIESIDVILERAGAKPQLQSGEDSHRSWGDNPGFLD